VIWISSPAAALDAQPVPMKRNARASPIAITIAVRFMVQPPSWIEIVVCPQALDGQSMECI
jgi:hypothetical protein